MPMNDFNDLAGSRSNQRLSFQTRGPGAKVMGRGKKGQVRFLLVLYFEAFLQHFSYSVLKINLDNSHVSHVML